MNLPKSKRLKWLTIRMSEAEHQAAQKLQRQTTCGSLSEYARKAVLGKPVIMRYHNQSLDDFIDCMDALLPQLKSIGGDFHQLILQLRSVKNVSSVQQWILHNEQEKTRLFRQIDSIQDTMNKIYEQWSHD